MQTRLNVILFGACAVIGTMRVILEVAHQTYNESVFSFVSIVLGAVSWTAAFIVSLKRYRSNKEEQ